MYTRNQRVMYWIVEIMKMGDEGKRGGKEWKDWRERGKGRGQKIHFEQK